MAVKVTPRGNQAAPARPAAAPRQAAPPTRPAPTPRAAAARPAPRAAAAQPVAAAGGVSLAPRDATMGGLIDDVNATIIDCGFYLTDYDGKADQSSPALIVQFETEAVDGAEPQVFDQIYSAGSQDHFVPSDDNTMLIPVGGKTGINNSTNCFRFLSSLVEVGFPEDVLAAGNIKAIIGTAGHVKRIAQPKRTGLIRQRGEEETREKTTLIFESISALPEGLEASQVQTPAPPARAAAPTTRAAVGGKPNGAARQPVAAAPAPEPPADDLDTLVFTCLQEVLQPNEQVEKRSLSPTLFPLLNEKVKAKEMDTKTKTAVINRANAEEFLNSLVEQSLAEYDGATLTLLG